MPTPVQRGAIGRKTPIYDGSVPIDRGESLPESLPSQAGLQRFPLSRCWSQPRGIAESIMAHEIIVPAW